MANNKIIILGAGKSGVGAAILAKKNAYEVFVSDISQIPEQYKNELDKHQILWEEGTHSENIILQGVEIIKSPGIPNDAEIIKAVKDKKIPVVSEIEFASRFTDGTIVGITGSNGKSTTSSLTYHMLKKAGLNVALAGNIGNSFAKQVAEKDMDYYVLEISSFQLDDIVNFKPHISVMLNITPDHMERYEHHFQNYIDSKFNIVKNQTEEDYFIYCLDDEVISQNIKNKSICAKAIPFSCKKKITEGAYLEKENIKIFLNKKNDFTMYLSKLALQGRHNVYNSMAAAVVASIFDIKKDVIRESLTDFQNLEHRLEFVTKVHGVEFINDSKATNVNSTWYALESTQKPVIWIAGGVDKGNDYSVLQELVKEKVKAIICLGKDNRNIHKAFSKLVDIMINTYSAEEAVKVAFHLANNGDRVILSPACASFDLFENFEERGREFKNAVKML